MGEYIVEADTREWLLRLVALARDLDEAATGLTLLCMADSILYVGGQARAEI